MGIISKFLISSAKNNDIKGVTFALAFDKTLKSFKNFFLAINPFSNARSFDINNNQSLDHALKYAAKNLNCEMTSVLINSGANIHSVDENGKNIITHAVENLAISKDLKLETAKNLPGKIVLHPIIQLLLSEGAEYYSTDDLNIEPNITQSIRDSSQPPRKPPRIFEYKSSESECKSHNTEEPIYSEIEDFVVHGSLDDSGYLSTSEESLYATIDDLSEQEKPVVLQQQKEPKETIEPIYAKVNFAAKREAREKKANGTENCRKSNKSMEKLTKHAIAGIYLKEGLIKERVSMYEQSIKEGQNSTVDQQQTNTRKIKSEAGLSVKQIKQKYEIGYDSGCESGYESDTKMEILRRKHDLPTIPASKVNSVRIECGIAEGHRYRT